MKLSLVGQDYTSRSLAVSAQSCVNVFPALIDDPNEASTTATVTAAAKGKNKGVLYGCPGKHLFKTLATDVRALLGGSGRAFAISGSNRIELNSSGAVVASLPFAAPDDGLPAQMFANGEQLLVIAGGLAFCDNGDGLGPQPCTTDPYAGMVNVFGTGVGWVSGDKFLSDGSWVGSTIVINGANYTVSDTPAPPTATQLYTTTPIAVSSPPSYGYTHLGAALTAVTGGVLDGTFFVQRPRNPAAVPDLGRQVNFSAVLDGTSWSGLDFFQKEGYSDYIRGIMADNQQLYLFGDETFEVWEADSNAGPDGNPFVQITGAMAHFGTRSPWTQVSLGGRVYFLGGDDRGMLCAYVLNGFTPVRISNHAQEAAWQAAGLGANAVAYAYTEEGHSFWVINFGSQTWAYEPETGAWHQRFKWNGSAFTPYLTNLHTFIPEWGSIGGVHLTACTIGPANVYQSDINFYDDEGTDIKWVRALSYVYNSGKWVFFGRADLEMETGTVASGPPPVITLDYSDDRGKTFKNPRTASLGAAGESSQRVYWNRGGKSRGRVPRLSGIGQSKVALIDLEWDITMGTV